MARGIQPTPEELESMLALIEDATDMIQGAGAHKDHTRRRSGLSITCSCGMRIQGRQPKEEKEKPDE